MRELNIKKSLLISDLDGTLLGDEKALHRFSEWINNHREIFGLVYATGRFFDSVKELIQGSDLPAPDAVISAVGTDIYFYPSGELMKSWHSKIKKNWDFVRIRSYLSSQEELELQPEEFQSEFKVSYYLKDATAGKIRELNEQLQKAAIEAEIIYSSSRDLDFLPRGVNKGTATAFLVSTLDVSPGDVLVSGDSGNDKALFEQGFRGIVVGNAQPELKSLKRPEVYHAKGFFAAGVLEGIKYWWKKYESN